MAREINRTVKQEEKSRFTLLTEESVDIDFSTEEKKEEKKTE